MIGKVAAPAAPYTRAEESIFFYRDSEDRRAEVRVRLLLSDAGWTAQALSSLEPGWQEWSGRGAGPDVFAIAREIAAGRQRQANADTLAATTGFQVIRGGRV